MNNKLATVGISVLLWFLLSSNLFAQPEFKPGDVLVFTPMFHEEEIILSTQLNVVAYDKNENIFDSEIVLEGELTYQGYTQDAHLELFQQYDNGELAGFLVVDDHFDIGAWLRIKPHGDHYIASIEYYLSPLEDNPDYYNQEAEAPTCLEYANQVYMVTRLE